MTKKKKWFRLVYQMEEDHTVRKEHTIASEWNKKSGTRQKWQSSRAHVQRVK